MRDSWRTADDGIHEELLTTVFMKTTRHFLYVAEYLVVKAQEKELYSLITVLCYWIKFHSLSAEISYKKKTNEKDLIQGIEHWLQISENQFSVARLKKSPPGNINSSAYKKFIAHLHTFIGCSVAVMVISVRSMEARSL